MAKTEEQKDLLADMILVPMNGRVLIRKDDPKGKTKGDIVLPDTAKTEVLTGRIVRISRDARNEPEKFGDLRNLDKVLVDPRNAIPVELEPDNKLFMIPVTDILAVFKKQEDYQEDED